jgi:glycosyltransferase involved in cell wall biosynthesis
VKQCHSNPPRDGRREEREHPRAQGKTGNAAPMRILQVVATLAPRYGGPSIACPELSRELVRLGHQVSIFTSNVDGSGNLDVPLGRPVMKDGVEVRYFHGWSRLGKYMFSPGLWRALGENVTKFDIVQVWSVYSFSTTAASYWCRKRGVPYIVFPHGSLDPYLRRRNRPRKWIYTKLFAERDYRKAPAALFNSSEEMRLASDWSGFARPQGGNGTTQKRFVVPIGVDPKWFQQPNAVAVERLRSRYSALAGRKVILYMGRLTFKKGLDILARAFAKIAREREDIHLLLAGPADDGYEQKVRGWLADGGVLEKATFAGIMEAENRFAVMQLADVFALSSYTENFGQAVAEAMASGLPVVISDQVNIWPEVSKAGAGLVVPCDADATAQALRNILDDPARARQMGRNGRYWVAENLPWDVVGAQMVRVYEDLVEGKKA